MLGFNESKIIIVQIYYQMINQDFSQFISVRGGDYVKIKSCSEVGHYFWIGQVINCIGGARDPNAWTLFQVININNGEISIINADTVEEILKSLGE